MILIKLYVNAWYAFNRYFSFLYFIPPYVISSLVVCCVISIYFSISVLYLLSYFCYLSKSRLLELHLRVEFVSWLFLF